jgi:hypothetical protein
MNTDLTNIPQEGDNKADKLNLLKQINAELNYEMFDDEDMFEDDATEGLQQIPEAHLPAMVNTLNANLNRHLKKKKKQRRNMPSQQSIYISIITILLLAIVAYIVIKKVL